MNKYTYKISRVPAEPRSKRLADTGREGASSAAGNVIVSGRGDSAPQYWERVITATDGAELPEEQYYLKPQGAANVCVPGDVTAYSDNPGKEPSRLPVSTDHETTGLFRAKRNGGLIYDVSTGSWMVDSQMMGGGLDEGKLKIYLDNNKYVNQQWLEQNGYMSLQTKLTGYAKITPYSPITPTDSLLTALGKLEENFGNYVDLATNQTIGGVKTFKDVLFGQKDIVAYASSTANPGLPVATNYVTTGLFRALSGGGLIYTNGGWRIDPSFQGGGLDKIDVNLSGTGNAVTSVTWDSTYKRLNVVKGTSFALLEHTHSQYATTSWVSNNFASASHTHSQYATTAWVNNNFASSEHTHDSRYYTINGINSLLEGYVTLGTAQTVTGYKTFSAGLITGDVSNIYIEHSSGNSINGRDKNAAISNLYLNYVSSSQFTRIDGSNNIVTAGDVVSYGVGSPTSNIPVADAYSYGLVKYDNSTIKKNSSGQLYCTVEGGGGSTTASYWRPSVNASGVLSWSLNSSTSAPSSVNIKGPKGDKGAPGADGAKGQGVNYQWSGTSLRLGTISSDGYTSWGSYVNLKGPKGDTGDAGSGGGGNADSLPSITYLRNGYTVLKGGGTLGVKFSGGNSIMGWNNNDNGNLYLNYQFPANLQVGIYNLKTYTGSDIRLKNRMESVKGVLDALDGLDAFYYTLKADKDKELRVGLSAQDVQRYFPIAVSEVTPEGEAPYLSLDYMMLHTIFSVQGLKELYSRFRPIETKVKGIEARLETAEAKLIHAWEEIFKLKGGTNGTTN